VPRSVRFVDELPRSGMNKVVKSELLKEVSA
jgi:acyl-coenzyme A synthetase/AMP-(fatty) acid ligase